MAIWHTRSKRKRTSGKFRRNSKRKKVHLGNEFTETTLGEQKVIEARVRGGNKKKRVKKGNVINLSDPSSGSTERVKIEDVIKNQSNPDLVRRDIITKGAVVQTEKGKVRITSRPGQDGLLNAVLLEEK